MTPIILFRTYFPFSFTSFDTPVHGTLVISVMTVIIPDSVDHNILCTIHTIILLYVGLCPALAPIPNGAITYGPDTFADFDVDTVATHTCNDGFILVVGSETRTCLVGGRWSGLIPVCQRT